MNRKHMIQIPKRAEKWENIFQPQADKRNHEPWYLIEN